jgi:hypothetical protein
MPNRIPVSAAKRFGEEQGCRQVIVFAWDGERTHCVTWGKSVEDCAQAADGGNKLKTFMGWPDSLLAEPTRVKKLLARISDLEAQVRYITTGKTG